MGKMKKGKLVSVLFLIVFISIAQFSFFTYITPSSSYRAPIPSGYGIHWWAGMSADSQTSDTATSVSMTIKTPDGYPNPVEDAYFVLLSVFDNGGSYDQIGFSTMDNSEDGDPNGLWGLTWSWCEYASNGDPIYHYQRIATVLAKDTYYTFEMSISNGYLTYRLYVGGWMEWTKTVHTGGNYFEIEQFTGEPYGYTVYEEVYDAYEGTCGYDFKFRYLYTDYTLYEDWVPMEDVGTPFGVDVVYNDYYNYVLIDNPTRSSGGGGGGITPW